MPALSVCIVRYLEGSANIWGPCKTRARRGRGYWVWRFSAGGLVAAGRIKAGQGFQRCRQVGGSDVRVLIHGQGDSAAPGENLGVLDVNPGRASLSPGPPPTLTATMAVRRKAMTMSGWSRRTGHRRSGRSRTVGTVVSATGRAGLQDSSISSPFVDGQVFVLRAFFVLASGSGSTSADEALRGRRVQFILPDREKVESGGRHHALHQLL